jgi:HK97 family phage prohead protease
MHKFLHLQDMRKKKEHPENPLLVKTFFDVEKVISKESRTIDFVISTSAMDRDTDTIDPKGWALDNYLKNPVVLWAHDSSCPPIGKSIRTAVEKGKLVSTCKFAPREISEFADMIFQMYLEGYLNAVSVGFRALEYDYSEEDSRPWGVDFKRQELMEYSCVPVPSNPEALVDAKNAGIDTSLLKTWAKHIFEDSDLLIPRNVIDELKEQLMPKIKQPLVEEQQTEPVVQEPVAEPAKEAPNEIEDLKAQLEAQLKEIAELKAKLEEDEEIEFDCSEKELADAIQNLVNEQVRQVTGQLS